MRRQHAAARSARPPIALTVAGTDPSGAVGLPADLKTFTARGVLGTAVVSALVVQNTRGISRVYPVDDETVEQQLYSVLVDMPVDATKTGMLACRSRVELVAQQRRTGATGFYTLDPVAASTSGHRLLEPDAVAAVRDLLLPGADLVTPNLAEAALLLGDEAEPAGSPVQMRQQARELIARGAGAVLITGGQAGTGQIIDVLATADDRAEEFASPRVPTTNTQGTGCTLSAAATAAIAEWKQTHTGRQPDSGVVRDAVTQARGYVYRALRSAAGWTVSYPSSEPTPDAEQDDNRTVGDPTATAYGPIDHAVDITHRQRTHIDPAGHGESPR